MDSTITQKDEKRKAKGAADIVFLIDATLSMTPCIEGIKESLKRFADSLSSYEYAQAMNLDWRAKVVPYRDFNCDGEPIYLDNAFTTDINDLKAQIAGIRVEGGGDIPESALDGLYLVTNKTDWRPKVHRFILMFTDADTHEELHDSNVPVNADRSLSTVAMALATTRVKIHAVTPETSNYKTLAKIPGSQFEWASSAGDAASVYEGLRNMDLGAVLERMAKTITETAAHETILA